MTDGVHHNVRLTDQRMIVHLDDVRMLNGRMDFDFAHGALLVLRTVAGDALAGVALARRAVLDQIDEAEAAARSNTYRQHGGLACL